MRKMEVYARNGIGGALVRAYRGSSMARCRHAAFGSYLLRKLAPRGARHCIAHSRL